MTAETILHRTKTPLTVWFWAAYLMTTDKRGLSALLLQRQLGLGNYETAWMMLHKFRRAMVNASREPLHGEVEVDDTWIGGTQAGLRGSRQLKGRKAALVLVGVEKRGQASGRVRMEVIPDFKAATLLAFLKKHVSPGATIYTDGLKSYSDLQVAGYRHVRFANGRTPSTVHSRLYVAKVSGHGRKITCGRRRCRCRRDTRRRSRHRSGPRGSWCDGLLHWTKRACQPLPIQSSGNG